MFSQYTFQSSDGSSTIAGYKWLPQEAPKAVLLIAHGVGEHSARYDAFARYLNSFGIAVFSNDHLGHGKSCEPKDWGFFGSQDGWLHFAGDIEKNRQLAAEEFPGVRQVLLGHSMGSFVCRTYLAKYGQNLDGAIIMGTSGKNPAVGAGKLVVNILKAIKGERHLSGFVTNLAFGGYQKHIENPRSGYEWLSHDHSIVERYDADPACGFIITLAGFSDMFNLLQFINSEDCYRNTPKDGRYFIVAGDEDPVGAYGKGPKEVFEKMKAHGIDNVDLKIYHGMRHEILNEIGKEKVYEDMKDFILA